MANLVLSEEAVAGGAEVQEPRPEVVVVRRTEEGRGAVRDGIPEAILNPMESKVHRRNRSIALKSEETSKLVHGWRMNSAHKKTMQKESELISPTIFLNYCSLIYFLDFVVASSRQQSLAALLKLFWHLWSKLSPCSSASGPSLSPPSARHTSLSVALCT